MIDLDVITYSIIFNDIKKERERETGSKEIWDESSYLVLETFSLKDTKESGNRRDKKEYDNSLRLVDLYFFFPRRNIMFVCCFSLLCLNYFSLLILLLLLPLLMFICSSVVGL